MRNKAESKRGQSGQILIYTTIIVMLAALILVPLMQFAFSSHKSAQIRQERTLELYASDAGIEDALYQIKTEKKGTDLANLGFGNSSAYLPRLPRMNDRKMDVSVQKVWLPQDLLGNLKTDAPVDSTTPSLDTDKSDKLVVVGMVKTVQATAGADDFDHGWPNGVSQVDGVNEGNWTGNWTTTGSASLASGGKSVNCLNFTGSSGTAMRQTILPKYMKPELQFWIKGSSFGSSDTVACEVSTVTNPTVESDWTTVMTWGMGNVTGSWPTGNCTIKLYDQYGIGDYSEAKPLWVRLVANLSSSIIASHDFEPPGNSVSGGTNWASNWVNSLGGSTLTSGTSIRSGNDGNGLPIQGSWYLRLIGSSTSSNRGYAQRKLNLSSYATPHLQFWAKAASFESGDYAYLQTRVGNSGSFTTRATWQHNGTGNYTDDNTYHFFDLDLSQYSGGGQSSFWIAFKSSMGGTDDYFYVDDIKIVQGPSFSVDNLWAGYQVNSVDLEIAYTDLSLGNAFLDRVGVWMPPGCNYMSVRGNETSVELNYEPTTKLTNTYAGGTILEWDFASPGVALHQPSGQLPIVKTLTFTYGVDVAQTVEGMFIWLEAHEGPSKLKTYLSWDKGYEIYKAVSKAHSEIYGTNTQVTAYASQGETNRNNMVSYGDYVATGNSLLIDSNQDTKRIRETANTPSYSTISTIPSDAEVKGAWLYWSAFRTDSAVADTQCDFMYPKEYGPEPFAVQDGNGNDVHTTVAHSTYSEPIVTLPRDIVVNLSPRRYCAEILGNATAGHGNDTFFTAHNPVLASPSAKVSVAGVLKTEGTDYVINYATGNVTIKNDALAGQVKINYSVSGSQTLTPAGNYTVNYASGLVTITNDCLAGNVTIDYWASHWSHNDPVPVTHAAYDQYGTVLLAVVHDNDGQGWSYVCFRDVTDLVKGTGNGQFGVDQVYATPGDEHQYYSHGYSWPEWCYSAWSIIIVYNSPSETAHQLYLYDPIHNRGTCPFYSGMNLDIPFTLNDFYPPAGLAEGRLTYFVGEGDGIYDGDSILFNGDPLHGNPASPPDSYDYKNSVNNPDSSDIMNSQSTTGEVGVDIDSWNILKDVGSATSANVKFHTDTDSWNLCYIVLSFKTNMKPKADYAFNVASVTYQYELGGK